MLFRSRGIHSSSGCWLPGPSHSQRAVWRWPLITSSLPRPAWAAPRLGAVAGEVLEGVGVGWVGVGGGGGGGRGGKAGCPVAGKTETRHRAPAAANQGLLAGLNAGAPIALAANANASCQVRSFARAEVGGYPGGWQRWQGKRISRISGSAGAVAQGVPCSTDWPGFLSHSLGYASRFSPRLAPLRYPSPGCGDG